MALFASKDGVLEVVRKVRPDFLDDAFLDEIIDAADDEIILVLSQEKLAIDDSSITEYMAHRCGRLLKRSASYWVLEQLTKMGLMTIYPSTVELTRNAEAEIRFQKTIPMFFFAKGAPTPFYRLLSEDSPRMKGYKFAEAFGDCWRKKRGHDVPPIDLFQPRDLTTRGYGWNVDQEVLQTADDESREDTY